MVGEGGVCGVAVVGLPVVGGVVILVHVVAWEWCSWLGEFVGSGGEGGWDSNRVLVRR